ncbi:hypothetical protein Patl_3894 [Paraglaciecola sp. T6c]|uniref:hypothetical protein n=1 Tax=Pseudoalteromonas atlantica (strain T6c / ATCC BAA-1087) TaxID=3042615 RepID=UPI00005C6656|nr:hypothetical protein [Paraglaciecola sp. T6c]ABG42394.1 hypothetical protein Patl_3894 [Paraglaciecola sp. T6c]
MIEAQSIQEKQSSPILIGVCATLLVLAISALIIAGFTQVFGLPFFLEWVGTFLLCATPFQVMMAVVWHHRVPSKIAEMSQPLKGVILTSMVLLAGSIITPILYFTVGQGVMSPILIHFAIQSVGVSLLVILIFGGWPINKLTDNPLWQGIAILIYCYLLNYVLFKLFYDYSFFSGLPFYSPELEPGGMFNGISALSFAVTVVAMVMVATMFELWPITKMGKDINQPLMGLLSTGLIVCVSGVVYYIFVGLLKMEPMDFMVKGPVCIIFGTFLVENMMQFQLFSQCVQPLKGLLKVVLCLIGAFVMYHLYSYALPFFAGTDLVPGPEMGYAREAWIGTATLGVTFPVINIIAGAFELWPVKRN